MFCEQCGSEIKENFNFCEKCGHPVSDMVNYVSSQPSIPTQPGYYGNSSQLIVKNKKKGIKFFVGAASVLFILVICVGIVFQKDEQKEKTNFEQQHPDEHVTDEYGIHENFENGILSEEDVNATEELDLGAYGQYIGYWAKNNVDTFSAETMWIQPPLVMEITEEFVMIHGPDYRVNREDLQYDEMNGIDYFTSAENGFRFYYSNSENLLVLELKTDSGDWMRWADFK